MNRNGIVVAGAVLLLTFLAAPALAQQQPGFNPRISLDQRYVDNVAYVDAAQGDTSDWVSRLEVLLPWVRTRPRSSFGLSYTPSFERHLEFDDLTRDEHRLNVVSSSEIGRRGSFNLSLGYSLSQNQSPAESLDDPDLFLNRRTERQVARLQLNFGHDTSPKTDWTYGLGGSVFRFEDISGFDDGLPATPVEDRSEFGANVGFRRTVSEQSSIGLQYGYRQFELDQSGNAMNHSMDLVWSRTATRNTSIDVALGAYMSSGRAEKSDPLSTDDSSVGGQVRFSVNRDFRESRLRLDLTHVPSVGGSQPGTSTNSAAGVTFRRDEGRYWSWRGSARYSRRDPTLNTEPTLSSVSVDGSVERSIGRSLGIQLQVGWAQQNGSGGVDDASRYTGSFGLAWYPRRI